MSAPAPGLGAGARSADGSVGSAATTVSAGSGSGSGSPPSGPGKGAGAGAGAGEDAHMGDAERDEGGGAASAMDISSLSVRGDDDDDDEEEEVGEGREDGRERGGRKVRTASIFSTSGGSSAAAVKDKDQDKDKGKERDARRKVPRTGSFYGLSSVSSSSSAAPSASTSTSSAAAITAPTAHHVDIVSYPPSELLRLLACLLEQIAQANDARTARASAAAAAAPPPPPASSSGAAAAAPTSPSAASAASSSSSAGPSTRRSSVDHEADHDAGSDWARGRFDAAPLNTPISSQHGQQRGAPPSRQRAAPGVGGPGGPGILDNALGTADAADDELSADAADADAPELQMPTTPGVDLLRETASGPGGGVAGFMPSLGGTHRPMPLGRRRGSSFVRNRREEGGAAGGAGGEKGLGGYGRRAGGAREAQGWSAPSQQQQQQASASSSTASSPSTSRPSSSAAPGPSPLPTPPAPSTSSSSHASPSDPPLSSLFSASTVALSSPSATLCFHARNVPAISIEAYLQRILKYCPTTNEVFLALLVYFDRMARIGLEAQRLGLPRDAPAATAAGAGAGGEQQQDAGGAPNPSKLFAIDSFNVHRLVIAGVTVASKFFSDVFYTNSRYAKVRSSSSLLALALVLSVEQHD